MAKHITLSGYSSRHTTKLVLHLLFEYVHQQYVIQFSNVCNLYIALEVWRDDTLLYKGLSAVLFCHLYIMLHNVFLNHINLAEYSIYCT